ncbi:AAA family ATPase [Gemmata sp. JC673]|uniref:AAA family ATPase n=1 Tax=Gemmata algarum TaxID=2975278 RepID=A0ABU5F969_9BACT|nr:AAA family ATPase [Gemmata algarum]MDY3563337.1 AAA family ATPase [Gemmata algarum]
MDLPHLIDALARPAAYPDAVEAVEVCQTHISVVFLAGEHVYKLKKPVAPGFLDFTTPDKRLHFCREEVRLNRRLAPDVYRGVVPVTRTATGLRFGGGGEPVEWAVKMRRLPNDATLLERLRRGGVGEALVVALAERLAAFHRAAETNDRIAAFGTFAAVARAVRDVFARAEAHAAKVLAPGVFARVRALTEEALARLQPLIDARAARGVPRDCHGDLHLDHIYHFPDAAPPNDLVVIDCIEFSEALRCTDPVADAAFVVMDLAFRGRRDLGRAFADAYFRASGDGEGRALLPLYTAYRAAVRGMVDELLLAEPEVPAAECERAAARSRAHWLLALAELETPDRRPGLLLVGGLPGSGKSTLARELAAAGGFELIRSDVVRKELAGLAVNRASPSEERAALYAPERTDRTYAECLSRAETLLRAGGRVIVDATFREERRRREFLDCATRHGVPGAVLVCAASPETTRARLAARTGDASDADWHVYERLAARWEDPGPDVSRVLAHVSTEGAPAEAVALARAALARLGLLGAEAR